MLKHKNNTNLKIWWLSALKTNICWKWGWFDMIFEHGWISRRMQKSADDIKRVWQFLPICRFSLFLTFPVPIIAAWICHSKDIALLQWHDFYCSWETAWIVMAILWPCASFSLSTEFLLLTLTQTFPGNAFPLSSGQIAFYCLGHGPIRVQFEHHQKYHGRTLCDFLN